MQAFACGLTEDSSKQTMRMRAAKMLEQFENVRSVKNEGVEGILKELYRQLLRRDATKDELYAAIHSLRNDPVKTIVEMAHSEELIANLLGAATSRTLLSNVLSYAFKFISGTEPQSKYFLHLPKTAGTSICTHIQEHSVFPWHFNASRQNLNSWPLVSGHHHWSFFPNSSTGFTILRDPIERLLSSWLFITSLRQARSQDVSLAGLLNCDFRSFLQWSKSNQVVAEMAVGASWFFTDSPNDIVSYQNSRRVDLTKTFTEVFDHVTHIGCIEDPTSVDTIIRFATDKDAEFLSGVNHTDRTGSAPQFLTRAEYDQLFELTAFEYQFLDFLFEKELVSFDYNAGIEDRLLRYLTARGVPVI